MAGTTYWIIPDTNAIRTSEGETHFTSNGFLHALKKVPPGVSVKVLITEVVFEEIVYQKMGIVKANLDKVTDGLKKLTAFSGKNVSYAHSLAALEKAVRKNALKEISKNGYHVAPISLIQNKEWQNIFHLGVTRSAPFQNGEKEKGFRDAVFCHTILAYTKKNAGMDCSIISGDGKVAEFFEGHPTLSVFKEIDAFVSEKRLAAEKAVSVDPATLIQVAREMFLIGSEKDSLFQRWKIGSEIEKLSKQRAVGSPAPLASHIAPGLYPLGAPKISVDDTLFLKHEGARILWTTRIEARDRMVDAMNPIGGSLAAFAPTRVETYEVIWEASLEGKSLTKPKLIEIKPLDSRYVFGTVGTNPFDNPVSSPLATYSGLTPAISGTGYLGAYNTSGEFRPIRTGFGDLLNAFTGDKPSESIGGDVSFLDRIGGFGGLDKK